MSRKCAPSCEVRRRRQQRFGSRILDRPQGPNPSRQVKCDGSSASSSGRRIPATYSYVMWHIEPDTKIAVSVKWNPGQRTHAQCGARGYANIRPRRAVRIPPIVPGASRTLQAELRTRDLTVRVDGAIVWDGTLPPEIADFDGPVGLRSDNARFEFEYFVGGLSPNSVAEPSTRQGARLDDPAVGAGAGG
jgi:hypothetical protein